MSNPTSPNKRKFEEVSKENDSNSITKHIAAKGVAVASPRPLTICVEGNIGCGKTTLLGHMALQQGVSVLEEPVAKWRNVRGQNLLDLMYQAPGRWAHLFQTYVQLTMMQQHLQPCEGRLKVLERSIHSARHCFVENLYQSGHMCDAEYNVYCEWYDMITTHLTVPVDLIVYLRVSPEEVARRIRQRGRQEEQGIAPQYLQELHRLHEAWLTSAALPAPLLVLPEGLSLQEMTERIHARIAALPSPALPAAADVTAPRPALAEISAN